MSTTTIIIACTALALLLGWLEVRRTDRRRLAGRLIATLLMVAALAGLIIPVTYTTQVTATAGHITLLTPGADRTNSTKAGATYTTDPKLVSTAVPYIPDLPAYLATHTDVKSIEVYGYGLNAHEQQVVQQRRIKINYHPAPIPEGFVAAHWNHYLRLGNPLEVEGTYHNTSRSAVKLVLSGAGTRLDSTTIVADSFSTFQLHTQPAYTGNILLEVSAEYPGQKIITEKVPLTIAPVTGMQVLLLSAAPTFDNKFLANWLYDHQYTVTTRSLVSKDRYAQQYLNTQAASLQHITPAMLQTVDVLITDDETLAALPAAERTAIQAQVSKGMGLILQADSTHSFSSFSNNFAVKKQGGQGTPARPLRLAGHTDPTHPLQPVQWLQLDNSPYDQPLVTDHNNNILAAGRLYGAGKLILNTVNNTFGWQLQGYPADYAQFWSLLLGKAARRQRRAQESIQATPWPTVGHPVGLTLQTNKTETATTIPIIHTTDGAVHLAQHAWLPDTWSGTWWPVEKGWHTIGHTDSTALYIYAPTDWTTVRASTTISNNTSYYQQQEKEKMQSGDHTTPVTKRVPIFIFWMMFIAGCLYVWIEAKLT